MVEMRSCQRKYRRIPVGSDYTVGFRMNGVDLKNIPVSNLSAGGCLALLPKDLAVNIHHGYLLLDFMLEHKELPKTPFCSQVVHLSPGLSGPDGEAVGFGISFLSTSPNFYAWVDAYIAERSSTH